ncbi:unnamed protein product [Phytophthora fragariaefolia]|uniref:Unnamed protein product n=1 Tax=Phytophthora fragariaefolia TaxID=1490495 RepID=A0A9W6XM76_9STRA|nr:unnamed protein product [Phytophthora fragariaefolia]
MPASKQHIPALLDPLHSPGSDEPAQLQPRTEQLAPPALLYLTLTAEDAGPTFRQNQATVEITETMVKTKRRMFSSPLLRRSATASSAAAASAASKIKSNLSTVTKLPTALKRSATSNASVSSDNKANVGRSPTIPSVSTSSTESSAKQEAPKQQSNKGFGIASMMRMRNGSKEDKTQSKPPQADCASNSPEDAKSEQSNTDSSSEAEGDNDEVGTPEAKSAINSASRFVMGMPTLLRRAVSNNAPAAAATQKKSPDTSANSTPRGQFPEDDFEENDRHSLLMMMQVPESRRNSQIPLMAASETCLGCWQSSGTRLQQPRETLAELHQPWPRLQQSRTFQEVVDVANNNSNEVCRRAVSQQNREREQHPRQIRRREREQSQEAHPHVLVASTPEVHHHERQRRAQKVDVHEGRHELNQNAQHATTSAPTTRVVSPSFRRGLETVTKSVSTSSQQQQQQQLLYVHEVHVEEEVEAEESEEHEVGHEPPDLEQSAESVRTAAPDGTHSQSCHALGP